MLRATIAGRRYWGWISSVAPVSSPAPSPPRPTTQLPCVPPPAADLPGTAELHLEATTLTPGATLAFSVVNTGQRCVTAGAGYVWQLQQADGSWQMVLPAGIFPDYGVILPPGQSYAKTAQLPADAAPGTYRLSDHVTTEGDPYPAGVIEMVSGPVTVTAVAGPS
jgi:hypothetical protein